MPFDPATFLDVSHLVTFLGGAAVGATGSYLGNRFTDQRRHQEAKRAERAQFAKLQTVMPGLLVEMAKDLREDSTKAVREFLVPPSRRILFRPGKLRFMYCVDECAGVENYVDRLLEAGYIDPVGNLDGPMSANVPIYRMREHFVTLLEKHYQ